MSPPPRIPASGRWPITWWQAERLKRRLRKLAESYMEAMNVAELQEAVSTLQRLAAPAMPRGQDIPHEGAK